MPKKNTWYRKRKKPKIYPYREVIQEALLNLPKKDRCTVFCYPISVLCKKFCCMLIKPSNNPHPESMRTEVLQTCHKLIQEMTGSYLTEMLGHARYFVAAAFVYIALNEYPHPISFHKLNQELFNEKVTDATLRQVTRKIIYFSNLALTSEKLRTKKKEYQQAARRKRQVKFRIHCYNSRVRCPFHILYNSCIYPFTCRRARTKARNWRKYLGLSTREVQKEKRRKFGVCRSPRITCAFAIQDLCTYYFTCTRQVTKGHERRIRWAK